MYSKFLEIAKNKYHEDSMVEFSCISSKCGIKYKVPKWHSNQSVYYKCAYCGEKAVKHLADNVIQIYPKHRRF